MKAYWSRFGPGEGNFGDRITPLLLNHVGVPARWAPVEHAEIVGVGSVLEKVPAGYRGMIWSAGLMHAESVVDLSSAEVLGVRGRLTRERIRCACPERIVLGDGGLLCHLLHSPAAARYPLGLVPHVVDREDPVVRGLAARHPEIAVIDLCGRTPEVLGTIAACETILSTSLHGLIIADSLGIPNRWIELNRGEERIAGKGFKFRDYFSVFDMDPPTPYALSGSDSVKTLAALCDGYTRPGLASIQAALRDSLEAIAQRYRAERLQREAAANEASRIWAERLPRILEALREFVPPGTTCILIDEDQLRSQLPWIRAVPFLEHGGLYWGPPADDDQAVNELHRMQQEGARVLAIIWPAFWWLDRYPRFAHCLRTHARCLVDSAEIILYDITSLRM